MLEQRSVDEGDQPCNERILVVRMGCDAVAGGGDGVDHPGGRRRAGGQREEAHGGRAGGDGLHDLDEVGGVAVEHDDDGGGLVGMVGEDVLQGVEQLDAAEVRGELLQRLGGLGERGLVEGHRGVEEPVEGAAEADDVEAGAGGQGVEGDVEAAADVEPDVGEHGAVHVDQEEQHGQEGGVAGRGDGVVERGEDEVGAHARVLLVQVVCGRLVLEVGPQLEQLALLLRVGRQRGGVQDALRQHQLADCRGRDGAASQRRVHLEMVLKGWWR